MLEETLKDDNTTINELKMKPNNRYNITNRPTDRHDSIRKEILFFADPHFLFLYFLPSASRVLSGAHLVLLNTQSRPSTTAKQSRTPLKINFAVSKTKRAASPTAPLKS
jgi:hypothetical protein